MRIGAHISMSGGHESALAYARDIGAECMQVFAKSPRQWRGKALDEEAAARFVALRAETDAGPLFTHTAYLINLATNKDDLWEKSVAALADELMRGHILGASGVATHMGNDPAGDPEAAGERVAKGILRAFEICDGRGARLLLENTAGAGTSYGATAVEIGRTISATGLSPEHLGICIDTCHAHAADYDVASEAGWKSLLTEVDDHCGPGRVALIHANDCKFPRGEHKDRHEWIGDGHIGSEGFRAMFVQEALASASVILEMPGEAPLKDSENISRLKSLRTTGKS